MRMAVELVGALADLDAFRLFVGATPNHPEAADAAQNIDWLKQNWMQAQTRDQSFEAEDFCVSRCYAKARITKPITPGSCPSKIGRA